MIQLAQNINLSKEIINKLKEYQDEIDVLATFELRNEKAKDVFPKRNKIGNTVFDTIKVKLTEMCSGARRCVYCEDSVADEVEHIHPKDLYPNFCFNWDNYVYACGNCNGPKNNKFAIFRNDNGKFHEVNPPKRTKATEPPAGSSALINPRIEDPLDYCMLDLSSTFKFVVIKKLGTSDAHKADYTFNTVLRLNEREFLRKARENAYTNYKSRLGYYSSEKISGTAQNKLDMLIENLKQEAHPTVWKEMQRQHSIGILKNIDNDLDELFVKSPEALNW
ncbi:MAG: hypothetical protein B7Y11_04970 [Sphingobacteriia bacterium 24-36-13]|jgi:uncharacterized protein (TIGR02646 family)|uniref:hypothetical protein n=1 Tax=Sediminibacterium sp. TaxID=1917865 RepID=UPI000BD11175|nr:hypothetical protein [Sediminibacterium sp.]OYZ54479.1 MAG: hypothetical protein B7Y11_04970 [Sphingobacteriia bacterium 24-36-13]HQS23876.1 hypothetical protein [Sediminibacterium sp.]